MWTIVVMTEAIRDCSAISWRVCETKWLHLGGSVCLVFRRCGECLSSTFLNFSSAFLQASLKALLLLSLGWAHSLCLLRAHVLCDCYGHQNRVKQIWAVLLQHSSPLWACIVVGPSNGCHSGFGAKTKWGALCFITVAFSKGFTKEECRLILCAPP